MVDKSDIWSRALAEAENSAARDSELWAKSFAEAGGEESKAKANYVKARVAQDTPFVAMGFCPSCTEPVPMNAARCECGADFIRGGWSPLANRPSKASYGAPAKSSPGVIKVAKSRGVYIVLALIFGCFGFHNFYANRYAIGAVQLVITLLLGWFIVGFMITGLWAIIEIFVIKVDGDGDAMA